MKQRKIIVLVLFSSMLLMLLPINTVEALTGNFYQVSHKDNGNGYQGVCSNNQFTFVACGTEGLRIYNKTSHNLLTTIYDGGNYEDVDVYDIWIAVACGGAGIYLYRFVYNSDLDYSLTLNDTNYGAIIDDYYTVYFNQPAGDYIFCGCGGDGIYAYTYDSGTGALTLAGNQLDDDGSASYHGITSDGSYIYCACGGDGIRAYLWDGAFFSLDDAINDATDSYYDITYASDGYLYTATMTAGVYVYSYAPGFVSLYNRTDSLGVGYINTWSNDTLIYFACQGEGLRAYTLYNSVTPNIMDYLGIVHPVPSTCLGVAGDETYVYYSAYSAGLYTYIFNLTTIPVITAPDIQTDPASGVSAHSATMNGEVIDDGGEPCTVWFEWGTTPAYGNRSSNQTKTTAQSFSASFIGILPPNTTYHYRACGNNTNGTDYGSDAQFQTLVASPDINTNPATSLNSTGATLSGIVTDDGGEQCQVWFEWGYTPAYGNTTAYQYKTTGQTYNQIIGSLNPNTTYHYRAVGNNSVDIDYGSDSQFTTGLISPNITTNPATGISKTGATLHGTVLNDGGELCNVWFVWGKTTSYGNTTAIQYKTTGQNYSAIIGTLTPGTTYHYKAYGNNSNGTSSGIDRQFTTTALPASPLIITNSATGITMTGGTLNGFVTNDGGETCYVWFEWGKTGTYGNTTITQYKTTGQSFGVPLSGLASGTTYHYKAYGNNTGGSANGIDRTFTTLAHTIAPNITTNIATTVLSTSATINGIVTNDGGGTCYVWFQWGYTNAYGNTTAIQYKTTGQSFIKALTGLTPNRTYHFRAFGNNTNTTSYGADLTFKTLTLHINVSWTHIFDDIGVMFTGGNHTLPNGTVVPVVGIFGGGMDTNALLGIFIFLILFVLTALFGMGMLVGSVIFIPTVFAVIGYIPELRIIVAIIVGIVFGLGLNRLVRR